MKILKCLLLLLSLSFFTAANAAPEVLSHDSQSPKFVQDILGHFQENINSIRLDQINQDSNIKDLSEREIREIQKIFSTPVQVSIEILGLLSKLHHEFLLQEKLLGEDELLRRISERRARHKVEIKIPNVGKAELNAFGVGKNAVIFTKVVHYGTNKNYVFIPPEMDTAFLKEQLARKDLTKEDRRTYKELLQQKDYYIARQIILTKNNGKAYKPLIAHPENERTVNEIREGLRNLSQHEKWNLFWELTMEKPNTQLRGRDTTVIFYNHGHFNKEKYKRPDSKMSLTYWKSYWRSIYERPSMPDINTGIYMGTAQFAISYLIGGIEIASLSAIWGSVLGVYGKTYVNWLTANDSIRSKTIKSWFVSMSFAYTYVATTQGFNAMIGLDMATFLLHLKYWSITYANNLAKVHFQQIPFLRKVNGENLGEKRVGPIRFPKAVLESQNAYLALFTFKIADMADFSIRIPGIDYDVKLGKLLLWGSIPVMELVSLKYAERHGFQEAAILRQDWQNKKAFSIPYLMTLHESIKYALNKIKIPYQGYSFNYMDGIYNDLLERGKNTKTYEKTQQSMQEIRKSLGDLQSAIRNSIYFMDPLADININRDLIMRQNFREPNRQENIGAGSCKQLFAF